MGSESARFNLVCNGPREQIYRTNAHPPEKTGTVELGENCQFDIEDVDENKIRGRCAFTLKGTGGRVGNFTLDPSKLREGSKTKMKLRVVLNDDFKEYEDLCEPLVFVEAELVGILDTPLPPLDEVVYRDWNINVVSAMDLMDKRNQKYNSCLGFVLFMLFAGVYVTLINEQLNTQSSFQIEEGLRSYMEGISTGVGSSGTGADRVTLQDVDWEGLTSIPRLWEWLIRAVVPAIYGTTKYNDADMLSYEKNYIASYNRVIGGMFLIQKRGARMNSDWCATKFRKFYPVCYSTEEDILKFGPNVQPGAGEEKFDAAKAAAQDAGATGEDFCKIQKPSDFCGKCLRTEWYDDRVHVFSQEPTCLQCIGMCVTYYGDMDKQQITLKKKPNHMGCYVCMASDVKLGSPKVNYEIRYSPAVLHWVTKGDQGAACKKPGLYDYCLTAMGSKCFAKLTETNCMPMLSGSGRRLEEGPTAGLQLYQGDDPFRRLATKTCAEFVSGRYGTDQYMDFKWKDRYGAYPCTYIAPLADDYGVNIANVTCAGSALAPEPCFNYNIRDGTCQQSCNVASCNFDGGDCKVGAAKICKCDKSWLGDGFCDLALGCNVTECGFDRGDCMPCSAECERAAQGDGVCDIKCNTQACGFDSAPVVYGCTDPEALNFLPHATRNMPDPNNKLLPWQCRYDGDTSLKTRCADPRATNPGVSAACTYDTKIVTLPANLELSTTSDCAAQCAPGCQGAWINDQNCDPVCNVPACNNDGKDCNGVQYCDAANQCPKSANALGIGASWVGDCHCDDVCNVKECSLAKDGKTVIADFSGILTETWDGGDCADNLSPRCKQCAAGCYNSWLGDGVCDPACNTADCSVDHGDCDWKKSEDYCECECCEGKWTLDVDCSAGAEVCASAPCLHNGACSDQSNDEYGIGMMEFKCVCASGWTGHQCELDVNECLSKPCVNGGACVDSCVTRDVATGICIFPWIAPDAVAYPSIMRDTLYRQHHPATLGVSLNKYGCKCAEGWRLGDTKRCSSTDTTCLKKEAQMLCQIDDDECSSNPCKNGICYQSQGNLKTPVATYNCLCTDGWANGRCNAGYIGEYTAECTVAEEGLCNVDINECASHPCQNGATCADSTHDSTVPVNAFACTCVLGWSNGLCNYTHSYPKKTSNCSVVAKGSTSQRGKPSSGVGTCNYDVDECSSSPCLHSGTCTESRGDSHISTWMYVCACAPGWHGVNCNVDYDECNSGPCTNGAMCTDSTNNAAISIDAFRCACLAGWANGFCANSVDEETGKVLSGFLAYKKGSSNVESCRISTGSKFCRISSYKKQCQVTAKHAHTASPNGSHFAGICNGDVNECASTPCQHGGKCHDSTSDSNIAIDVYLCVCPTGASGWDCEVDTDECGSQPCQNGATCMDSRFNASLPSSDYSCRCVSGWGSRNCDVDVNECKTSPCGNGGNCIESSALPAMCRVSPTLRPPACQYAVPLASHICVCNGGWHGKDCHTDVNECSSKPCSNKAVCVDSNSDKRVQAGTYTCRCQSGYTKGLCNTTMSEYSTLCAVFGGGNCDEDINECLSKPCKHGAACAESNRDSTVPVGKYYCRCAAGYSNGMCAYTSIKQYAQSCKTDGNCDVDVNECISKPCLNGAVCQDSRVNVNVHPNTFQCLCKTGYANGICSTSTIYQYQDRCSIVGGTSVHHAPMRKACS